MGPRSPGPPGFRGEASSEKGSPKGESQLMGAGMATGRWQDHRENVWYQRVFMGSQDGRVSTDVSIAHTWLTAWTSQSSPGSF